MSQDPSIPSGKVSDAANVGKLVAQHRKTQGLTQADLADLANTGIRFIGELERGKSTAQLEKTLHVLAKLGLDVLIRERAK